MSRTIAVKHRIKVTAENEAHPTLVTIVSENGTKHIELESEQDELDFVNGEYPVKYRAATATDRLTSFRSWHLKWRKLGDAAPLHESHVRTENEGKKSEKQFVLHQVPCEYDGLRKDDTILIQLGGSGDRLASAMARTLMPIGGMVCRVSPHITKTHKGERDVSDIEVLLELWEQDSDAFYIIDEPELGLHPYAITVLAGMFRLAEEKCQLIVSTQSSPLVDHLQLEDLIVVDRMNGETTLSKPDPDALKVWMDEYSVGELWDKNLIGGMPQP